MKERGRKLLDKGKSRIATVDAVEGCGSVSVHSLLNRNSLGVSDDGVWRDDASLVRVFMNKVLLLLRWWWRRRLIRRIIGDSDSWFLGLRHCGLQFNSIQFTNIFLRSA